MTDRKALARLRRQRRQMQSRPPVAPPTHTHEQHLAILERDVDYLEDAAIAAANEAGFDLDDVWSAICHVRQTLGLPPGRSPAQRERESLSEFWGTCKDCGESDWREDERGAICNRCYPAVTA